MGVRVGLPVGTSDRADITSKFYSWGTGSGMEQRMKLFMELVNGKHPSRCWVSSAVACLCASGNPLLSNNTSQPGTTVVLHTFPILLAHQCDPLEDGAG